jgi:hypothetical protein
MPMRAETWFDKRAVRAVTKFDYGITAFFFT